MKSDTIRNDYAAARISAISAIIAAEAIGVPKRSLHRISKPTFWLDTRI